MINQDTTGRMDIMSILSYPGGNEGHSMQPPNLDENGLIWESALPLAGWIAVGPVFGCANAATVVTWLNLKEPVSYIRGLVAAPPTMDLIDLDGIRVFHSSLLLQGERHDEWIKYHATSTSIGTAPLGWMPQAIPASGNRDDPVPKSTSDMFRSDEADGAVSHVGEEGQDTTALEGNGQWSVPGGFISEVTIWSGNTLHGFHFQPLAAKNHPDYHGPRWGKCGGIQSAKWAVGPNCVSFFSFSFFFFFKIKVLSISSKC